MIRHYIRTSQTTIHPEDEGFADLTDAEKELQKCVADDLAEARRRWPQASKIVVRPAQAYAIHACKDRQSALWREWWIQTIE